MGIDNTVRMHLKRECLNYLRSHPRSIQLGVTNVEDLCLSLGKLLCLIGGTLDGNDCDKSVPLGQDAESIVNLGQHFREVALLIMMDVKAAKTSGLEATLKSFQAQINLLNAQIGGRR